MTDQNRADQIAAAATAADGEVTGPPFPPFPPPQEFTGPAALHKARYWALAADDAAREAGREEGMTSELYALRRAEAFAAVSRAYSAIAGLTRPPAYARVLTAADEAAADAWREAAQ